MVARGVSVYCPVPKIPGISLVSFSVLNSRRLMVKLPSRRHVYEWPSGSWHLHSRRSGCCSTLLFPPVPWISSHVSISSQTIIWSTSFHFILWHDRWLIIKQIAQFSLDLQYFTPPLVAQAWSCKFERNRYQNWLGRTQVVFMCYR